MKSDLFINKGSSKVEKKENCDDESPSRAETRNKSHLEEEEFLENYQEFAKRVLSKFERQWALFQGAPSNGLGLSRRIRVMASDSKVEFIML